MMNELGATRHLVANETLFTAGDDSDSVYLVLEGSLDVLHDTDEGDLVVGTFGPTEILGEITAVIGGRRTATVRAGGAPVTVREFSADEYAAWLQDRPEEAQRIADQARDRIDQTRVTRVLIDLIGSGYPDVIDDVNELLEWTRVQAGDRLFAQGDTADAAYIVVTGRLRLTAELDGVQVLDASIGRGDIVGELGIIEQAPRSATVTATRDSTLARLSETAFQTLTGRHPKLMLQVFRKILTRVMRPNLRPPHAGMIAVAVLSPNADPNMVRSMCDEIETHGPTLHLDRDQVSRFFNRRGVLDDDASSVEHARLDEFLNEADVAHRWVVLETDPELTTWSRRALRSADRVLLVTSPFPDDRELDLIKSFAAAVENVSDRELWMVQTNAASISRPTVNRAVIDACRPDRILQHHRRVASSTARLARLSSSTATGIALSGGGGRSFAQVGALCALAEAGYHLDVVSGTSMGSIVGGMFSVLGDPTVLAAELEEGFGRATIMDYTLPIVSLAAGKGLTEALDEWCGPLLIEELRLPFSCLSTNLTTARLFEHRAGRLAQAVRASVSLPGIFPPVAVDGELLVDGGVMENLPVGPLVRDPAVGKIIAVDVAPAEGPASNVDYGSGVGGREALRNQVLRGRPSYPGIASTVMASMLLSSARARNDALAQDNIDVYLSLNLDGVRLMDFRGIAEVADRGYQATIEHLQNL